MRLKKSTILVLATFLILAYLSNNSNSMTLDFEKSDLGIGSNKTSPQEVHSRVISRGDGPNIATIINSFSAPSPTDQRIRPVGSGSFINAGNTMYYDPTVQFGNNSFNRIKAIKTAGFSVGRLSGSSTTDNINVTPVPEPGSMILFGAGLAGIVGVRFRPKK